MSELTPNEVRSRIADALERAAVAHEEERYGDLADEYREVDAAWTAGTGDQRVGAAINFLDGWVDASHHEWLYYDGVGQDDWPRLGRAVASALRSPRDLPAEVGNHPQFRVKDSARDPSILARIRRLLGL